jgi:hypothetical protein
MNPDSKNDIVYRVFIHVQQSCRGADADPLGSMANDALYRFRWKVSSMESCPECRRKSLSADAAIQKRPLFFAVSATDRNVALLFEPEF